LKENEEGDFEVKELSDKSFSEITDNMQKTKLYLKIYIPSGTLSSNELLTKRQK